MNAQEIIDKFKGLYDRGIEIGNLYTVLFSKNTSPINIDKPRARFEKFSLESDYQPYTSGFFIISYSYNDSCNCHPEYRDWEELLPIEWLDFFGLELEEQILKFIDKKIEDRQKEIDKNKQKETEKKEKKQKEQEQQERETLEKLKKKYGN